MAPKGNGSKRNPVRLFSFDSLKSSSSRSSLDNLEHVLGGRGSPKPSIDHIPEKQDRGNREAADQNWTEKELVESPKLGEEPLSFLTPSVGPERRVNPAPENLNRSAHSGEDPLLVSRPRARWEHLRQHVTGVPSRPNTPPNAPSRPASPTSHNLPPPRAQTAKPSRLARLGFRHVVDQARELDVDETRKFASELQNICWSIQSAEGQKKVDREPTGSTLYFPFMSNSSLSTMGSSSVDNFTHGSNKKIEIRRPPSLHSLAHAHYSISSIRPLYQSLLQHATPSVNRLRPTSSLPLEAQVLSTLFTPFTTFERGIHVDDEMRLAAEAFDLLTRTWLPSDEVSPSSVRDVASLIKRTGHWS
jgi:hypothetical protein